MSVRESWVIAAKDLGLEGSATCQTKRLCASRSLLSQLRYSTDTAPKRPASLRHRPGGFGEEKRKRAGLFTIFTLPNLPPSFK